MECSGLDTCTGAALGAVQVYGLENAPSPTRPPVFTKVYMLARSKLNARFVYLFIEFSASAFFSMMFVTTSLYEATIAGLTAVQLILVGTALEISAFVFEVPTGIVADVYSRRLSIIIGYLLMGFGFLVEGFFPAFLPILLAQVIWGLGYTFTSGATQAWVSDEIGEDAANQLFLRGTQVGLFASLLGMGGAMLIGANNVALPIQVGAFGVMLIGVTLLLIMPETGFHPTPREDRNTWQHMWHTFRQGATAVRSRPRLMNIVFIGLFYGLYSEGFDRLWVKHLLDTFELPILFGSNQVAFFAALRVAGAILTILAVRLVEKRVDSTSPFAIGRAVLVVTGTISVALIGFALSPFLFLSLSLYLVVSVLRNVHIPLQTAWVNHKLDSQVRATVHSMFGQVDAIGQTLGGPLVAAIASVSSAIASLVTSGLLLTPALFFIERANLSSREDPEAEPLPVD
jgi:DHA3 family tetracycline resistance protein-like MFS transporter